MQGFVGRGRWAALVLIALWAWPTRGLSQRLGLFFDDNAAQCAAAIEPFAAIEVKIFAFFPPDSLVSGVLFQLVAPPDIEVVTGSFRFSRALGDIQSSGELISGIDLRFESCQSGTDPLLIAEFEVEDQSFMGSRNDLRLELRGGAADSTQLFEPHFRICDPNDPLGEGRGIYEALSVDATLNCTASCGCTTAVLSRRWGEIKGLYR